MGLLTDIAKVKLVSGGEEDIQALAADDPVVLQVMDQVELQVSESTYGRFTQIAQTYLAAHFLKMAFNSANADGKLSGETIGGISQEFTLPYFTTKTVLGATQYGMQFLEYRNMVLPAVQVVPIIS